VSCNKYISEVSLYSNLQEGDSISVALFSKNTERYSTVNGVAISSVDVTRCRLDIPLPDSLTRNIVAFAFTIYSGSERIITISSIRLNGYIKVFPEDVMRSLWWQDGVMFEIDAKSNVIQSHIKKNIPSSFPVAVSLFFEPHLIGFQLFFRIFLLASLLILTIFISVKAY